MATPTWLHVNTQHTTNYRLGLGNSYYRGISGTNTAENTLEAAAQATLQDAAVLSYLQLSVRTNTGPDGSITVVSRVNGSTGNMSVAVAGGATGVAADASNTDSVSAGDEVATRQTDTCTGAGNFISTVAMHVASDGTPTYIGADSAITTGPGFTQYLALSGRMVGSTTEQNRQVTLRTSTVLSMLRGYQQSNSIVGGTVTVRVRKNAGNGNGIIQWAAGVTGEAVDASNTDTYAAGDEGNYQFVTSGSSGNAGLDLVQTKAASVARRLIVSTNNSHTEDAWMSVEGSGSTTGAGTGRVVTTNAPFRAQNFYVYLSASVSGVANAYVQKNGSNSAITVAFGSGVTGVQEDVSNTADYAASDTINYLLDFISGTSVASQVYSVEMIEAPGGGGSPFVGMMPVGDQARGALARY